MIFAEGIEDYLQSLVPGPDPVMAEIWSIAQANRTLDQAQRCRLYHRIEQIIVDDAPWVPLYTPVRVSLVAPRVTRFYMNPVWYAFDFAFYQVSK